MTPSMSRATTPAVEPLPAGTRVLHVGPHKTGTATLQGAFHAGRGDLRDLGVRYAGRTRQAIEAAHAVTSLAWQNAAGRTPSLRAWHALVREVERASEPRVVISSESFSNATAAQARRIAEDLGPALHVVITARPIGRVLPSRWQQSVQDGITSPFEAWLAGVLDSPQSEQTGFWRCQRHDQLAARWADVLGPERVTAVVVDDADHRFVLDAFEALLELPPGTLLAQGDLSNRSLTLSEVEAIRGFNLAFVGAGLGSALASPLHGRVMRRGAAAFMKSRPPAADEPRVALPAWALTSIRATSAAIVDGLRASGVRVVGEVDRLLEVSGEEQAGEGNAAGDPRPRGAAEMPCIPPSVATALSLGVLMTTSAARSGAGRGWPGWSDAFADVGGGPVPEPPHVTSFTTYQVAGTIAGRAWNRALDLRDGVIRRRPPGAAIEAALQLPRRWASAPATDCVAPAAIATAALDLLVATRHLRAVGATADGTRRLRRGGRRWPEPPELARIGTIGLAGIVARRAIHDARRTIARRGRRRRFG